MFKNMKSMLFYNFKSLIGFEFIFKILSIFIFSPIFLSLFSFIMKYTGYSYLTLENITFFLANPLTIFLIFLLLVFITAYSMFDISTIIVIMEAGMQKRKISIKEAICISFKKTLKVFLPFNLPFVFIILFLIPLLNIGVASSFITTIKIPEFIMDYIRQHIVLLISLIILFLLLIKLLLKWLYAIHYYVIEDCSFFKAIKKSNGLSKKSDFKDLVKLIVIQALLFLIYFLFILLGIGLIIGINHFLSKLLIINSLFITIIWIFLAISLILYFALSVPISYATISYLFYQNKKEIDEEIIHINFKEQDESTNSIKKRWKLKVLIVATMLIFGTIFTYGLIKGKYNLNIEFARIMEITAHRGASINYPENTMSAFIGAKELGADWIELDVQMTKDGKIIVLHDTNLKRTTGVNKNTWNLDYEEIKKLDAGSWFDKKFANEKIPLLEDVIIWAKNSNMRLNIELKPTGKEKDFEKEVLEIIRKNHFEKYCVVTSQVYEVLERVKEIDENIKTIYVMSLAFGNVLKLDKADGFSIEATSVTESLVKKIHKEGKEIYAWTVNTETNINRMLDLNVDNIITDNIKYAKELTYKSKTSDLITEYIKFLENFFHGNKIRI